MIKFGDGIRQLCALDRIIAIIGAVIPIALLLDKAYKMSLALDLMWPESGTACQRLISSIPPFRMPVVKTFVRVEIHQLQTIIQ